MSAAVNVAVLKYNAGNVQSVLFALERLGVSPVLTADPEKLAAASHVVFPGVGEASSTMAHLRATGLDDVVRRLTQPVLGVCLGMQLLCAHTEEGDTAGLGVFPNRVRRLPAAPGLKVPHMGWNELKTLRGPLFEGIDDGAHVYFANSFAADVAETTAATADHGGPFSAALMDGNRHGVQFHPEKSGPVGARLLRNFLAL